MVKACCVPGMGSNLNKCMLNRSEANKQPPPVRLLAQAQIRLRLLVTGYRHWVVP